MKIVKSRLMVLCSTIFALMLVFSMVLVSATQGNTWTTRKSMATARHWCRVAVVDGKIYAIGGHGSNGYLNSVEEYDPAKDTWTTKASMATARTDHQIAVVDGKIYAIGGYNGSYLNSVEEYDPKTNTWIIKASMATGRHLHQIAVVDGKIYVIGGNGSSGYLNSVEEYDPAKDTWTTKASMATARRGHQVPVVDGKIYAIGGFNGGYLNSVEEYDPETNTWITKASMATGRRYHQIEVVGGKIYAIGGYNGSYLNSVEEYDPETDTWITKASMHTGRIHKIAVVEGKIYAIGGYNGGYLNSVEEYDPTANKWITKTSMSNARADFQVAFVNEKIYAISGYNTSGILNSLEEYMLEYPAQVNLTAVAGNSKVNLSWTASENAASYNIKRSTTAGGPYTTIATVTSVNYTDTEVTNGTTYYYVVSALKNDVESLNSAEVSAKPEGIAKVPANLTAKAGNAKVSLSWEVSENATGYNIKRSITSGSSYKTIAASSQPTYTDTTAANGTTYYYVVVALNSAGESANSNEVMAKPIGIATAPNELKAIAENAKVKLSWTASENATGYIIKRSTTADGPYTTIATGSAIIYTDTTVTNGTTYYYVVSAVNEVGESANTKEVSVKPVDSDVTLEVTSVDKSKVGNEITANVVIHNAANICAEDIKVAFDTSILEFISAKGAEGIKIYKEDSLTEGIRRYITASLGKANAANGDKILLQLTFKAKASGEAKIDITSGRIADNATLEKDIEEKNCGEKIILIEEKSKDVNRSGEFTLLDLGIDAWYYGDAAANTDPSKYDADVVANGTIDDDDLAEIVKQILSNSNYPVASK